MSFFDLFTWKTKQDQAAAHELSYIKTRIKEVESVLGIPHADTSSWNFSRCKARLSNLQSQAAIHVRKELKTI